MWKRKRKNFKFPAVFPIIFFNGSGKWTVPTNLKEMFAGHKRFGDYLINFNYSLVDVKGYNDESVKNFQSKLLKVMMMFEKSESDEDLYKVIEKYKSEIVRLNEEEKRIIIIAVDILSRIYGQKPSYKLNEILQVKSAERVNSMLSDMLANPKKVQNQIIKKAKAERDMEIAEKLLKMGDSIEKIAAVTKLSVKEIEKIKENLDLKS